MAFNWLSFFRTYNIAYTEQGPNVARGHVNVKCPFCGTSDPSEHMGVELDTGKWGCWRDQSHRGSRPARLLRALIDCTWDEAKRLEEDGAGEAIGWEALTAQIEELDAPRVPTAAEFKPIEWDTNFHVPSWSGPMRERACRYLQRRGFEEADVQSVIHQYRLKAALTGRFAHRLILPYFYAGQLIGWTARAMGRAEQRYLAHPPGNTLRHTLFNNHSIVNTGAEVLLVVEGPLDALKMDFYGKPFLRAVALATSTFSLSQINELHRLSTAFNRVAILLDQGAEQQAEQLRSHLSSIDAQVVFMPAGVDDPCDMTPAQVRSFCKSI